MLRLLSAWFLGAAPVHMMSQTATKQLQTHTSRGLFTTL